MKKETKVVCPKCGTSFAIPEHEMIAIARIIGKDSNLGTVTLTAEDEERVHAARNLLHSLDILGINPDVVSNAISKSNDRENTVAAGIMQEGDVKNPMLYRRFVMGHFLYAMQYGLQKWIKSHGYRYMWNMMANEFYVQEKMRRNSSSHYEYTDEDYEMRSNFFNRHIVRECLYDYFIQLREKLRNSEEHTSRDGKVYVRLFSRSYYKDDTIVKDTYKGFVDRIHSESTPADIANVIRDFISNKKLFPINNSFTLPKNWINAYKGAGAYYTMENLIRFHGCFIANGCVRCYGDEGVKVIRSAAKTYRREGWRMVGVLKKMIEDNKLSIADKLKEIND